MIKPVHIQYLYEDIQKGRIAHETWESNRPKEVPKSIRYVVGFKKSASVPLDWKDLVNNVSLDERVKIIANSTNLGFIEEYSAWVLESGKVRKMDDEKGHFVYPVEFEQRGIKIKEKLKPASLRYAPKDSHELYRNGNTDIAPTEKTLLFYDDSLAAQITLENYSDDARGPDAAPYGDLVVRFRNGDEMKKSWSAWDPNLREFLERDIRKNLGEDISSFELLGDKL